MTTYQGQPAVLKSIILSNLVRPLVAYAPQGKPSKNEAFISPSPETLFQVRDVGLPVFWLHASRTASCHGQDQLPA